MQGTWLVEGRALQVALYLGGNQNHVSACERPLLRLSDAVTRSHAELCSDACAPISSLNCDGLPRTRQVLDHLSFPVVSFPKSRWSCGVSHDASSPACPRAEHSLVVLPTITVVLACFLLTI